MRTGRLVLICAMVGLSARVATCQTYSVVVTNLSSPPLCDGSSTSYLNLTGPVTVPLSSCAVRVNITASSSSADIGRISLTGGSNNLNVDIILSNSATINQNDTLGIITGRDWGGLDTSGMTNPIRARLAGAIGGDLTGSVTVGEIFRFDVFGEIRAQVRAVRPGNVGGIFVVEAGTITSAGSVLLDSGSILRVAAKSPGSIAGPITASGGRIYDVFATGGDLLGDIGSNGAIRNVDAGGTIGTVSNPIAITSAGNGGNIDLVRGASIYANISTPNSASPRGDVIQVVTTSGPFVGSLTTYAMQGTDLGVPAISVAGNLDADIHALTIKRPVTIGGYFPAGRTIQLDEDLKAQAPLTISGSGGLQGDLVVGTTLAGNVTLPSNGLGGQIIINSTNVGGTWLGTVTVNGTALSSPPDYTNTSASIGGGAVGLAPFDLHSADCTPADQSSHSFTSTTTVVLRHYGPVSWTALTVPLQVS